MSVGLRTRLPIFRAMRWAQCCTAAKTRCQAHSNAYLSMHNSIFSNFLEVFR